MGLLTIMYYVTCLTWELEQNIHIKHKRLFNKTNKWRKICLSSGCTYFSNAFYLNSSINNLKYLQHKTWNYYVMDWKSQVRGLGEILLKKINNIKNTYGNLQTGSYKPQLKQVSPLKLLINKNTYSYSSCKVLCCGHLNAKSEGTLNFSNTCRHVNSSIRPPHCSRLHHHTL